MSYLVPSTSSFQPTGRSSQGEIRSELQRQSPHIASIHILNDDSLLYLFYLYRPPIFDGDESGDDRILGGRRWDREQWWYKLAHVCRRWRKLILGSASYLGICLVCTYGTPVADMLAHSPPFPLIIDYLGDHRDIRAEEEGIILALGERDRVCRIRLQMPVPKMQKIIMSIDEEYPVLEYLIMWPSTGDDSVTLVFSESFQAPHLRHLMLFSFSLPIGSRFIMTAVGIVTLGIFMRQPSTYFQPNTLVEWISFMPQLDTLLISFLSPVPNRYVGRQLTHTPHMTQVTLPNLRSFGFRGVSAYLEAVVRRITAPRLEKLAVQFFKQLTFSVPRLVQFMNTTENLRFDSSEVVFSGNEVYAKLYREGDEAYVLSVSVFCWHLDWQVSFVAQFFDSRGQIFPAVEKLALYHEVHNRSSEEHNHVDRAEWRKLLRSFNNVKNLRVEDGLVEKLSRSLLLDNGELPPGLLPELQELTYSGDDNIGDAFTPFVDARLKAGLPVNLVGPSSNSVTLPRSTGLV